MNGTIDRGVERALRDGLDRVRLRLPVMPEIATHVRQAVSDPSSNALKLSQIIERDAALAARILRLANSAMFAGLLEIRSLHQAIARLGASMVVAVVVGAASKETFRSADPEFEGLVAAAWKRSLMAAILGRHLALRFGLDADEGFLAGLLHAVGEPVLVDAAATLSREGILRAVTASELAPVLETLRAPAGALLLRSWKLPDGTVDAVAFQADPDDAPPAARPAALITGASAVLARRFLDGETPPSCVNVGSRQVAVADVAALHGQVMAEYGELGAMF